MAPTWSSLHRLYGGLIGKALFITGLASPLLLLKDLGITLDSAPLFFLGAALVVVGFMVEQFFIPTIPKAYASREAYAAVSLERLKDKALDIFFEFSELSSLENTAIVKLINRVSLPETFIKYFPIDNKTTIGTLGAEKVTYYAAIVNYEMFDQERPIVRFSLILIFVLGVALIYSKTLHSMFKLIVG